jgi:hypothetical protein
MIYLKHTTETQVVRIPASYPKQGGVVTFEMVNTINRGEAQVYTFDQAVYLVDSEGAFVHDADDLQIVVYAAADASRLYYVLNVDLPEDVTPGEYEYTASVAGEVVSCGLAIVGEPKASVTSYDKPVQYEQYRQ